MSIIIETSMNFCSNCGSAELVKKIPEGDNLERFVCNKFEMNAFKHQSERDSFEQLSSTFI